MRYYLTAEQIIKSSDPNFLIDWLKEHDFLIDIICENELRIRDPIVELIIEWNNLKDKTKFNSTDSFTNCLIFECSEDDYMLFKLTCL